VVKILECVGEHYECYDQPIARVYKWCPATITLECECGETHPYLIKNHLRRVRGGSYGRFRRSVGNAYGGR